MKTILNIAIVALLALTIVSCKDDLPAGEGIPQIYVSGATTALPTQVETYTVGDASGSFTWSVSDTKVASISGSGKTADVTFKNPGSVRITVKSGNQEGYVDVLVSGIDAGVTVSYNKDGMLREDSTGTVTFTFDAPLAKDPKFGLQSAADGILATLGTFAGSGDTYSVDVTGGTGNGTAMAYLRDVVVADNFGGDSADTIAVSLFTIDNVQPAAESSTAYEGSWVTWGTDVTATVTFNEAMRPAMTDAADTAFWVYVTYNRDLSEDAGVINDSVMLTTEDWITWTGSMTIPDSISHGGTYSRDYTNSATATRGELLDLAGNELVEDLDMSFISYSVDRTAPLTPSTWVSEPKAKPEGTGNERWLDLTASSWDSGVGVAGYYYHIKQAYDKDNKKGYKGVGPKSLEDFTSELDEDGEVSMLMSTDSARYDVFWIAVDAFGFASDIDSARIQYNKNGEFAYNSDNTVVEVVEIVAEK